MVLLKRLRCGGDDVGEAAQVRWTTPHQKCASGRLGKDGVVRRGCSGAVVLEVRGEGAWSSRDSFQRRKR
jgi:hypothetical protein